MSPDRYTQAHTPAVTSLLCCGDPEHDHLVHEIQEPETEDRFAAMAPHCPEQPGGDR